MFTSPAPQHAWLKKLVGEWSYESECGAGPDQPAAKVHGTESVRLLGDLWVICESRGQMPDGNSMSALMTLGFDPAKNKFVGTWIGSPMANLFVYEGILSPDQRVLPLDTTGPSFTDPAKTAHYQDVIEFTPEGHRLFWSQVRQDDGSWQKFMTARYTRTK